MPQVIQKDDGTEMEVYTADEYTAVKTAGETAAKTAKDEADVARKEAETAKAEATRIARLHADQANNFKRYKDMTEEEKAKLTSNEVEARKIAEAAEDRARALEDSYNKDKEVAVTALKMKALAKYSAGDDELKKKLEENWDLINIKGTDEDTINRRAEMAFNMTGTKRNNPLRQSWSGDAPNKGGEKFGDTERAKTVDKLIGEIKF